MKMKKRMIALLCGAMAVGMLSGCGSRSAASNQEAETQSAAEMAEAQETETEEERAEGRTLVVYYSAGGHTREAANMIAAAVGADLFELELTEPYTDEDLDWADSESRVSREHENEEERNVELVSTTVEDWESYDTVLIGYPIWWGIAAWPVNSFVEENDFTGKTVIPFCTSASSDIGDSGQLLEEMAGTGNWLEGQRFRSSASEEDVVAWVDSLGW
ncbi:MAG: flavodoxin [Lachnospiraceae bacterium]|nr:flavodoxin [Lachnospiraceae bacterium]